MSLLSYASPWKNDAPVDSGAPSRKRVPTIGKDSRKTVKNRPSDYDENYYQEDDVPDSMKTNVKPGPETVEQRMQKQTEQNTRVNSILNRITSFSSDDRLGDFNPMPYPTVVKMNNSDQILASEPGIEVEENPLMPKTRVSGPDRGLSGAYYKPADSAASNYMNYRQAYGKEGLVVKREAPYYSKMGIQGQGQGKGMEGTGDKLMDRINYMAQMLESLQMEKTNHVAEEFVLYTLLGIFMIYIVDGFSRGGKYIR
jgi:hypothetical protein